MTCCDLVKWKGIRTDSPCAGYDADPIHFEK